MVEKDSIITSVQNQRVKAARALKGARQRRQQQRLLLEGRKHIAEAFGAGAQLEECFFDTEALDEESRSFLTKLEAAGVPLIAVSERVLAAVADTTTPQGMVAVAQMPAEKGPALLRSSEMVVVADGVSDPGNAGTILRTAAAVGAGLIFSSGCVDITGPKVARASAGALYAVPLWTHSSVEEVAANLDSAGYIIVATAVGAETSFYDVNYTGKVALVIGNEAHGISAIWQGKARTVKIPMPGRAESLNAGVAAALVMYEALRQRLYPRG